VAHGSAAQRRARAAAMGRRCARTCEMNHFAPISLLRSSDVCSVPFFACRSAIVTQPNAAERASTFSAASGIVGPE